MVSPAADIFRQAAELNVSDPRRKGSTIHLEEGCELIVSGDLHGNRNAFNKIIAHAALDANPSCRLVLQEMGHGPLDPKSGHDRSIDLLLRAARLKIQHPQQILFLMGNHDLAQFTGNEITKEGRGVCKAFVAGTHFAFGEQGDEVLAAVNDFFRSMPLAIRCPNGAMLSHSLPAPSRMTLAGTDVLQRDYREADYHRGGSVYEWTWGRGQTAEQLDQLAAELGADFFILGHRHVETGYEIFAPRGLVIASDHEHGYIVQFSGDLAMNAEIALECVKPIAALGI